MTVMTGALYPQRPGALSRGAYSFRNGGWADLATALGMGILSADGQNVTLPQGIAAGLQNFQQTSRDRQQEQRQTWLDQMTQQQFDLTKSEAEARAQDRKDEKARKERLRALLMGGPAMPIDQGGPAAGQFMKPGSPGLAGDLGIPDVLARALAEEADPTVFASLFGQKATRDAQAKRDAEGMAWDREKFDKQYALDVKQLGVSAANAAASRRIQEAELELKRQELTGADFGSGVEGKSLATIDALAPVVAAGQASPEQLRRYGLAYSQVYGPKTTFDIATGQPKTIVNEPPPGIPAPPSSQQFSGDQIQMPGSRVYVGEPTRMTAEQGKVATFSDRMTLSDEVLRQNESALLDPAQHAAKSVPYGGNYLVSPEFQQADQATRDFVNAVLRRESGAVISPEEFDNARKQYLPQPGDSPQVLEQKRQNRQTVIQGFAREAGGAYKLPKVDQTTSADFAGRMRSMSNDAIDAMDVSTLSAADAQAVLDEINRRKQAGKW